MLAPPITIRPRLNWYGSPSGQSVDSAESVLAGALTGPVSAKTNSAVTPNGIGLDGVPIWKVPPAVGSLAVGPVTMIVSTRSFLRLSEGSGGALVNFGGDVSKESVPSTRKA